MTRKALLIGNGAYAGKFALRNAVNDAEAVAAALYRNGFDVTLLKNITAQGMNEAALAFGKSLRPGGAGAFYFAGHGVQISGSNYLVGIDADHESKASTTQHALELDYILNLMDDARSETNILILDACRNDPWGSGWDRSMAIGGLAPVSAPRGTLIAFSTSPGETSLDGDGAHGRYTEALLKHIDAVCPVETMFKRVRATMAATSTKQIPWEHTSLIAEFHFNRSRNVPRTHYSDQAIQDGSFLADPTKPAHALLGPLRIHDYHDQNWAVGKFTAVAANGFSENDCFMIGRALYSAAVGDAYRAKDWIASFVDSTAGMAQAKRKSVLDGMLFEVFFDKEGKLRSEPKTEFLDDLYGLAKIHELRTSFEFLADSLVQTGKSFYAFPDLESSVAVNVLTLTDAENTVPAVTGIMIDGRNILVSQYASDEPVRQIYYRETETSFRRRIALEAAIPSTRLSVQYPDLATTPAELRFPYWHSLKWAF